MQRLWGSFWIRALVTALIAVPTCFLALWCTLPAARFISIALAFEKEIYIASSLYFRAEMLFAVLPVVPFWLLAEPRLWGRREPMPLGSYAIFLLLFFPIFYISAYLDITTSQDNGALGLTLLILAYLGGAALAAGGGYGYYRYWQQGQNRLPPVIPDVF